MAEADSSRDEVQAEYEVSAGLEVIHMEGPSLAKEHRAMMKEIWRSKTLSDLTLCAGQRVFPIHKFVLLAHTTYFSRHPHHLDRAIEQTSVEEDAAILHWMMVYLYEGQADVPKESVRQLLRAAESWGIEGLRQQCQYGLLLHSPVNINTCLTMWTVGRDNQDQAFSEKGLSFALDHFQTLRDQAEFLKLSFDCLKEYLVHPQLRALSPDDRLVAAMAWVRQDRDNRKQNLYTLLDTLPLSDMHDWYLKQVLQDDLMEGHGLARRCLHDALSQLSGKHREPSKGPMSDSQGQLHLVFTGHMKSEKRPDAFTRFFQLWGAHDVPSKEIVAYGLEGNVQVTLGQIETDYVPLGTKCCVGGNHLYIGGLNNSYKELWRLDLKGDTRGSARMVSSFQINRTGHALCWIGNRLYIIGGRNGPHSCTSTVEVYNPDTGKGGDLLYSNIYGYSNINNLVCCPLPSANAILVYGAFTYSGIHAAALKIRLQHTVQLFSLNRMKTTHYVTLARKSGLSVIAIVPCYQQGRATKCILIARDYTTILSIENLKERRGDQSEYRNKYCVPNYNCGVALTKDRQYLMLVGGIPKKGNPSHFVYRAKVDDLLQDQGEGWEQVPSSWPLGVCSMAAFDMASL